jgi:transcriptional regulator with XRE-family HTH domain
VDYLKYQKPIEYHFAKKMKPKNYTSSEVSAPLEQRRKGLGMSRPTLAKRSGVSLPTINRILSGRWEQATYANLLAVANALGMDFELRSKTDALEFAEQQAKTKAEVIARMVRGTSALEAQAINIDTYKQIISQTIHELMAGSRRRLWS